MQRIARERELVLLLLPTGASRHIRPRHAAVVVPADGHEGWKAPWAKAGGGVG